MAVPALAATPDLSGDGKADLIWRNTTSGSLVIWKMNGAALSSASSMGAVGTDWEVHGLADFDNNAVADILWRNRTTGEVVLWFMNSGGLLSAATLGAVSSDWVIQGAGDFNVDGKADILWRNSTTGQVVVWYMNGGTLTSSQSLGTVSSDWVIQEVGNFSGTGLGSSADIVWRNSTSGEVVIWLMGSGGFAGAASLGAVPSSWTIERIGDFNGDGQADLLWRQGSTGTTVVWFMNGTAVSSSIHAGTVSSEWEIRDVGNFDGQNGADIVWQSRLNGTTVVWLMNGSGVLSAGAPGSVSADWWMSPIRYPSSEAFLFVARHNETRANGSFGPSNPSPSPMLGGTRWSTTVAAVASAYANNCVYAHSNNPSYGENIYAAAGFTPTAQNVVTSWASEAADYTYSTNTCAAGKACGHYTQVVWRDSTKIGCAIKACSTGSPFQGVTNWTFAICNYDGPGNYTGQKPY